MKQTTATITPEIVSLVLPSEKNFPRRPNEGEILQIERATNLLVLGLHWTIKLDWSYKHKIPASRKMAQALMPLGKFFHQIFLLCAAVHARQKALPARLPYSDAGEWFILILKGHLDQIVADVLLPLPLQPENELVIKTYKGDEKRRQIRTLMENPRLVLRGKNPLKTNPCLVALSDLIDAAIALAADSPQFKKQYLKPFTEAWRASLQEMESEHWQRQFVKGEQLFLQRSKSKGAINLSAQKNAQENTLLKRLP